MRRKSLFIALCGLIAAVGFTGSAHASISYQYITDAANYTGAPGTQVIAQVYLLESLTGAGQQSLIANDNGLLAAGFAAQQNSGVATGFDTLNTINGDATLFDGGTFIDSSTQTTTFIQAGELTGITDTSGPTPDLSGLIHLGEIVIDIPSDSSNGQVTNFTLTAYGNPPPFETPSYGGNTVTFNNLFDMDLSNTSDISTSIPAGFDYTGTTAQAFNTFTVTTAVPEPATIGLTVLGLCVIAQRRTIRRISPR